MVQAYDSDLGGIVKLSGPFEVEVLRSVSTHTEIAMRKLLTFLVALASIAFGVCSPAGAAIAYVGSGNDTE
jgi:hypothetical protein